MNEKKSCIVYKQQSHFLLIIHTKESKEHMFMFFDKPPFILRDHDFLSLKETILLLKKVATEIEQKLEKISLSKNKMNEEVLAKNRLVNNNDRFGKHN